MTRDELIGEFHLAFFKAWNSYPRRWLGVHVVKYPTDMFIYHMIINNNRPDVIIETGSYLGGGALFFASMCDLVNHGEVLSIDVRALGRRPKHPRITYLTGRCTGADTLQKVKEFMKDKTGMVVLDSNHRSRHVKRELFYYNQFVSMNQYLVVEDTMLGTYIPWKYVGDSPKHAVDWFLPRNKNFVDDKLEEHYLVSMAPGGWLRRVK